MKNISIIGGGVAGLSIAILLHQNDILFDLYERRNKNGSKGHGFIIPSEGLKILSEIIDMETLYRKGTILKEYHALNQMGNLLEKKTLENTFVISRRSLTKLLESNLPLEKIHHNKILETTKSQFEGKSILHFEDGAIVLPSTIIAADGSKSRIRRKIFPDNELQLTQVNEIVNIIQDAELSRVIGDKFLKFHHQEGGLALGVLKVSENEVLWYVQFDITKFPLTDDSSEGIRQFMSLHFSDWCDPIPYIINNTAFENAHYWKVYELDELEDYYSGNTVFIGDTAHPLIPFTSQGVTSALKDAQLLVNLLLEFPNEKEKAFQKYSEIRKEQMQIHFENGKLLRANFLLPLNEQQKNIVPISYK